MNRPRLVMRSLWYYRRTNIGILLGCAVAAAVITGALAVGDSVSYSLRHMALQRLGKVHVALVAGDRFFRDDLADELAIDMDAQAAALIQMQATAVHPDATGRANSVQVLGIDETFWRLAPQQTDIGPLTGGQVIISRRLADQLQVGQGTTVILRVPKPGTLPRDLPMGREEDASVALRVEVIGVIGDDEFGRFSLQSGQIPPYNAFVSRAWLQKRLELPGRSNLLLMGEGIAIGDARASLAACWQLADAELAWRTVSSGRQIELRSRRVLIDSHVSDISGKLGGASIFTYFVNSISLGDRSTPYSMVSALDYDLADGLSDDQIVINEWLADDLGASVGQTLQLKYFVAGDDRRLTERSARFTVSRVVPMRGLAEDKQLMPDFPGLAEAEHCRKWDPGIPIDLDAIRPKDEAYWQAYRGTPKAFITLEAGRRLWQNRFGDLTAIRFDKRQGTQQQIEAQIKAHLHPADIGLVFTDVRTLALKASSESLDFGSLFLSMSFFLVFAAALLTGLLFVFGTEQRSAQIGTLMAIGWRVGAIKRLLLCEGAVLAVVGSAIGSMAGLVYTRTVLAALGTIWQDAVAQASIHFHTKAITLVAGGLIAVAVALLAMVWTLGRFARETAKVMLSDQGGLRKQSRHPFWCALLSALSGGTALLLALMSDPATGQSAAAIFFGVGTLVLLSGLLATLYLFCRRSIANTAGGLGSVGKLMVGRASRPSSAGTADPPPQSGVSRQSLSRSALGVRNVTRRPGRSMATVALLACGVFMIVAVGANRQSSGQHALERTSGTGGFALYGRSSLPIIQTLDRPENLVELGLEHELAQGVAVVAMRWRRGDDASCLNLNRAQVPQLVGVRPDKLALRGAFTFAQQLATEPPAKGWRILSAHREPGTPVPAVADQATVIWALGKKLGDTIRYTDERGQDFQVQIVGMLAGSILQGQIIISESAFTEHFPSVSGYQMFLIDVPPDHHLQLQSALTQLFEDSGLELTLTVDRLTTLNAVQNAYLSIFQALGGLGLVLASAGLGMVVMRNVLQRRSELALLRAVGFSSRQVRRMIVAEHGLLVVLGLVIGMAAVLVALVPSLGSITQTGTIWDALLTAGVVGVSGMLWVQLAAWTALRGTMISALRSQ